MQENSLLTELIALRDKKKQMGKIAEGRMPTVCKDETLAEMARLKPTTLAELSHITGIGNTFIEKYGDDFIKVIQKYTDSKENNNVSLTDRTKVTLKELSNKLVNINRKNRLLYMSKITPKYAYSLEGELNFNAFDILFKNAEIKICDVSNGLLDREEENNKYKKLSILLREVERDRREKGQFDLYIAYPFVIGRLSGENFDVRAPLMLFPVEFNKTSDYISLKLDNNRDIVYNSNLLLAYYKFNSINKPLPNSVIEDISEENFINDMIKFYLDENIKLIDNRDETIKFTEYKANEFPKYNNGDLFIENAMVLGKFPTYSSSIQKDLDALIEKNSINKTLEELLASVNEIEDMYNDSIELEEVEKEDKLLSLSERNITYINELNSAQENVIDAIKNRDNLVVEGPPGTGKSQTITSLITDFVKDGKNVLMVSEKKSALDVVYSRLGELNQFVLMLDDINDKSAFYKQIAKLFTLSGANSQYNTDLGQMNNVIDNDIKKLENIADKLYSPSERGIEFYKLFLMNKKFDFANPNAFKEYQLLKQNVSQICLNTNYLNLENSRIKFLNESVMNLIAKYFEINTVAWWMEYIKGNLSEYEISECIFNAEELSNSISSWKDSNIFSKPFAYFNLKNKVADFVNKYFFSNNSLILKEFIKNNNFKECISQYKEYITSRTATKELNEFETEYVKAILYIAKNQNKSFIDANIALFDFIVNEWVISFEAQNKGIFSDICNFNNIISEISSTIAIKKDVTKKMVTNILKGSLSNMANSKYQGEMLRQVESGRKWSVNKFINKFSFELFNSIKVWMLTPEVASEILPLDDDMFDLLIFDEASQLFIEKGLPAISRAKKVVIAGDSKQLRPSSLGVGRIEIEDDIDEMDDLDSNAAVEEESLLDLARFKYIPPVLLNFHYRSKYEELIAFSNYAFYKGRLYVSPNIEKPSTPPIEVIKLDNARWENRCNYEEAKTIVQLLKNILTTRTNNQTIGIITFNSNQRDLIDDLIDEECNKDYAFAAMIRTEMSREKDGEDIGLFVKNIENVQGDERDIIIFSIGYAKNENGRLIRNFGWLNQKGGENRLNVAISRSKEKIYIVTSFEPSELQVEDTKNDGPRFLKKYLEYCFAVSRNDNFAAKQVLMSFGDADDNSNIKFDSDFENQVYDMLVERGYEVETQVGIGGYSIDLAIKQKGKYVLGIECDGKLYHSSLSARERDYHRQKYLESRGWNIHRIWSTDWWKNPDLEIKKITSKLEALG